MLRLHQVEFKGDRCPDVDIIWGVKNEPELEEELKKMKASHKLFWIQVLHTLVWLFFVGLIFFIVSSGITGNITAFTWIAMGSIIGEGLVLLLFKMFCPLTLIARKYSDSKKANFDIFLPEWLAKYNKEIFTSIYVLGVILVLLRYFDVF